MKRVSKRVRLPGTLLLIIVSSLITVLLGPVVNAISLPPLFKPFALPLFVVLTLILVVAAALQHIQQRTETSAPAFLPIARVRLLAKVRQYWYLERLEPLALGLPPLARHYTEHPEMLVNPWRQRSPHATHSLTTRTVVQSDSSLTDLFDASAGEVLLLGEAGTGKTTTLLGLAKDLLTRAEQNEQVPLPLIFSLVSWQRRQLPLYDWLLDELHSLYQLPRSQGKALLEHYHCVLLLDGLDELHRDALPLCLKNVNAFRQTHGMIQMVVCSRWIDYREVLIPLQLHRAFVLEPLTVEQIDLYLESAGAHYAALQVVLRRDSFLRELATTPLMLGILMQSYKDMSLQQSSQEEHEVQRWYIFTTYVEAMLTHSQYGSDLKRYVSWLTWIARQLDAQSLAEFSLDDIQPVWIRGQKHWYWLYKILVLFVVWCLFGGGMSLAFLALSAPGAWLFGFCFGLLLGTLATHVRDIKPVELVIWSWAKWRKQMWLVVIIVCLSFLVGATAYTLAVGAVFAAIFGSIIMLLGGLSEQKRDAKKHFQPTQVFRSSARNGLIYGCILGLPVGIVFGVMLHSQLGLALGATFFLIGVWIFGGEAWVEHLLLRFVLWRMHALPWRLMHFLDDAVVCMLLRRSGGGYAFLHRLLREYFLSL